MKHAGSVHRDILCWMFEFSILLSFIGLCRTLTPPRILYGGWTPILQGHPFFFGPIKPKNLEQSYQHQNPPLGQFYEPHEVEHHTEHHVQFVNPKHYHYNKQLDIYQPPIKSQHISHGHQLKDIFSYYPPQSAYGTQKHPDYEHKPVYFEVPRKPLDAFKNVPIKSFGLHNLKSLHQDENMYLKVTPLGNPNALKHIGQLNAKQIQYLNPVLKQTNPIKDALLYPKYNIPVTKQTYETRHPKHIQSGIAEVTYNTLHYPNNVNSYKSNKFQMNNYHVAKRRPLNPIETKYFNSHVTTPNLQDISSNQKLHKKHPLSNLPYVPSSQIYSTNRNLHSNIKPSIGLNKNLISPSIRSKHVANQMTNYLTSQFSHYSPFDPTRVHNPLYKTAGYPYRASKTLPLRTASRLVSPELLKNYLHKNVKLHTLYKNPSVVTNIRGSPAIVEREVAIIHVPVDSDGYANEKDYLHHTASTPKSTQILDIVNINESVPYVTLHRHIPVLKNNESYTHITLDYGRGQDLAHVTFVEPVTDSQIHSLFEGINGIDDRQQEDQYIYVSSNGIEAPILHNENFKSNSKLLYSDEPEAKKQFFHAYYASADHVPPQGYVKMTVEKFKNLFKAAEIRYVDNDPESILQNGANYGN